MEFRSTVIRGHSGPIYALAVDGEFVYSTSSDCFVTRWEISTGNQDGFTIKLDSPAYTIHLHDHILYVGSVNGTVRAIDTKSKNLLWENNRFGKSIFALCVSEVLDLLLVGDLEGNLFGIDNKGKSAWYFPLDSGKIRVIREFDQHFYVGSQDGNLRCFQLPSLNEVWCAEVHKGSVYSVLKLDSGLISAGFDGKVSFINDSGQIHRSLPIHYQAVYGLEEFKDGFVSCSKDKTIKVWDKNWKSLARLEGVGMHLRSVNSIVVGDFGFASAGDDKTIRIWNNI